jgi:hypothetical protein
MNGRAGREVHGTGQDRGEKEFEIRILTSQIMR